MNETNIHNRAVKNKNKGKYRTQKIQENTGQLQKYRKIQDLQDRWDHCDYATGLHPELGKSPSEQNCSAFPQLPSNAPNKHKMPAVEQDTLRERHRMPLQETPLLLWSNLRWAVGLLSCQLSGKICRRFGTDMADGNHQCGVVPRPPPPCNPDSHAQNSNNYNYGVSV